MDSFYKVRSDLRKFAKTKIRVTLKRGMAERQNTPPNPKMQNGRIYYQILKHGNNV